jgi:hypothetical protein
VYTSDLQKDLEMLKDHFDFSNYPKNHPLFNEERKNALGYVKLS